MRGGAAVLALVLAVTACGSGDRRIVVAVGTTLVDSGLIEALADRYEADHPGLQLSVVGESSTRVLELGRRGSADLLITHNPDAEARFLEEGLAVDYRPLFESSFLLVGPVDRVAELGVRDVTSALAEIARRRWPFVTRADGSGTHAAERALWARTGIDPGGEAWYLETGQGMGLTLQVTAQRRAFTLAEAGTFAASDLGLGVVAAADVDNRYHATVVDGPGAHEALRFVKWLVSPDGGVAVRELGPRLWGSPVFEPVG